MKLTYDIYPTYEKCIQKLTWKWVKRSKFDFNELLSETNQAFLKAVDSYDSSKACFHTHLYITINGNLRNYCNQKENQNLEINKLQLSSKIKNPEENACFKNLIENLSKEAKEMVDVVLNTPLEIIELVREMSSNRQGHMHVYKSNIKAYFKAKGWKQALILSCFDEIKSTFN